MTNARDPARTRRNRYRRAPRIATSEACDPAPPPTRWTDLQETWHADRARVSQCLVASRLMAKANKDSGRPPLGIRPLELAVQRLGVIHGWSAVHAVPCVAWWARRELGWDVTSKRALRAVRGGADLGKSTFVCPQCTARAVEHLWARVLDAKERGEAEQARTEPAPLVYAVNPRVE